MENLQALTLAELVTRQSGAAIVFGKYQLDFCCNGKRTLQEACKAKGLDAVRISSELEAIFSNPEAPTKEKFNTMQLSELADYIEQKHHVYVRQMIPTLVAHTQKVADRHGANNSNLIEIADLWLALAEELTEHMRKEEMILFPYIKRMEEAERNGNREHFPHQAFVSHPIQVMEIEHDKAGQIMKELRALSDQFTPPLMACTTYRLSFRELREFEADLHQHIHLENNILFPKAMKLEQELIDPTALVG